MAVVHVEDRIFLQCVLVVTRRQKNSEPMLDTQGAGERRHQLAYAALCVFAKERMNLERRARCCDGKTIFSPRPHRCAIVYQHRLEIKIGPLCLNLKFSSAAFPANRFDIEIPVVVRAERDPTAVLRISDLD